MDQGSLPVQPPPPPDPFHQAPFHGPGPLPKQRILELLQKLKEMRARGINNNDPNYRNIVAILKTQDLKRYFPGTASTANNTETQASRDNGPATGLPIAPTPVVRHPYPPEAVIQPNASSKQETSFASNMPPRVSPSAFSTESVHSPTVTNVPPPMPQTASQLVPITPSTNPSDAGTSSTSYSRYGSPSSLNAQYGGPPTAPNIPTVPGHPPRVFTSLQMDQLKQQITTYKKLIGGEYVSDEELASCRSREGVGASASFPTQPYSTSRPLHTQPTSVNAPIGNKTSPFQIVPSHPSKPTTFVSVNNPAASVTTTAVRKAPTLPISPSAPVVDATIVITDREKRIRAKFASRLQELTKAHEEGSLSLADQIEFEQIKLLGTQHKIRMDVIVHLRDAIQNKSKAKGSTRRKRTRGDKSRVKKQAKLSKEKEFLLAITSHAKEFKDHYYAHSQKWKKINRQMKTFHAAKARREEQQRERAEKERLRALRENDEVAYLKLLEQTKNERLSQLLHQTDDYLNQIGAKVREAKDRGEQLKATDNPMGKERKSLNEMTEEEKKALMAREEEEAKQLQSTKTYYTIAHTIKEDINEQPEILVGGTLKPYQLRGLQWLISLYNNNLNGVLADEMGLGKTIQTIALLTYLIEKKACNGPFLIVVPLSVLPNWQNELRHWAPSIVSVTYRGNAATRKSLYQNQMAHGKFNVALTTYDFVIRDKTNLAKIEWTYIIIDEGHRIKNANSKLTVVLSKYYRSRYRLLLTGTPLQNSLPELWSLLNFLLPTIFNSVENFQNWFSAPFASAGERSELTEEETALIIHRLHKVLRPFLLRRLKQEVEDQLPKKVEKVLRCDLSAMQKKLYDTIVNHGVVLCDPSTKRGNAKGLNNTLMELRKVCNHPYLCNTNDYLINEDMIRCAGKFVLLDNLLRKMQASGHRVLIFSQMTEVMTILGDMLAYRGYQFLRLDGSTSSEERGTLPDLFNDPNSPYFVFILSTRAGGMGLNLQAADTVIIFDSDWNPQMDLQAQDRAHRIGQKNAVSVFRLISVNSVEEDILDKANHKLDVDKKIIQAGMFNNRSSVVERKEFLMKLLTEKEEADLMEVPTPKAFNKMISRSEEEYVLFQKMDKEREAERLEKWNGNPPALLMQDHELPEWLTAGHREPDEDETVYGRGRRQRGDVNYNLNESSHAIDLGESFEGALPLSPPMEPEPAPLKTKRKRSRSRAASKESGKRKRKEKTQRTTKKKTKLGHNPELTNKLLEIYNEVRYCQDEYERERSYLFQKLPSKRDYPDYYQIIKDPIDLKTIKRRITSEYYETMDQFHADMSLLFANAMRYNVEGSQVYQDAICMKELCDYKVKELKETLDH